MAKQKKNEDIRTINEWSKGFKNLYAEANKNRRPEEYWFSVMANVSSVCEGIRKVHYGELMEYAALTFCWMCGFINHMNNPATKTKDPLFYFDEDFSSIVALKYPDKCGHCTSSPCMCNTKEKDAETGKGVDYRKLYNIYWNNDTVDWSKRTIQGWIISFETIYSALNHIQSLERIGFHLFEELGEEARAIRELIHFRGAINDVEGVDDEFLKKLFSMEGLIDEYYNTIETLKKTYGVKDEKDAIKKIKPSDNRPEIIKARIVKEKVNLITEFGDSFSWFCAVLIKIEEIIKYEGLKDKEIVKNFHLEDVLQKKYGKKKKSDGTSNSLVCPKCKKPKCSSVFYPDKLYD